MPKIPFDEDDGRFEFAEPPELSEAAKQALARQQKLDDANFITERTLAFQRDMAAEFARAKADGEAGDPMFVKDLMKLASEMRSEHLSDVPRGPGGRLISQDAVDLTRANMDGAMERFSTAALHRLNLERHQRAFANIGAAGSEIAAAAKRDAKGLSGLLSTVDDLLDQYEGVFADDEAADQRARLRAGAVTAAIDGLIERGKTGDARELVTGGTVDADLGPGAARFLLDRIDKTEKDNARNAVKQADKANTVAVADLDFRVATGQAFAEELDFEFEEGTISAAEYAEFLAELKRFDVDSARRADGAARVKGKLANGEKPDAGDPADRAAVDVLFDDLAEAIAERPPEEKANIETRFVRRTGMLPNALRDSLLGGMFSEDPAAQVAAAGRFVAFEDSDPVLIAEIPADILDRARTITAFAYPGLAPARIVKLAAEKMARQEAEAVQAEDIKDDEDDAPDLPGESPDKRDGGAPPVIDEIVQAPLPKPAADPFKLTPEQKNQARQTIATVDNQGADKLTREERITALKYLHRKQNLTSQEREVAITIFRTFKIDPAFEAQEEPKRVSLLKQLPKDEIIKNAEKNWPRLTPEEKLTALDRAVDIHATIFGTEKPKVRLKDLGFSGAQYDQRTNTISIDLSGFLAKDDPGIAFGNIIHEAIHAQQFQLAEAFSAGKIKPGDPRRLQAQVFALNGGQFYSRPIKIPRSIPERSGFSKEEKESYKDYLKQPVEDHATRLTGRVENAFRELFQWRMKRELGK